MCGELTSNVAVMMLDVLLVLAGSCCKEWDRTKVTDWMSACEA